MSLEEIKEQYAKEKHYDNWNQFFFRGTEKAVSKGIDEIAKSYAKAKLEEAAEVKNENLEKTVDALRGLVNLKIHKDKNGKDSLYEDMQPKVWERAKTVLQSITNTPLD